ncbi:MAG: endonuclease, partial [Pseudomonadota bacterium]
MTAFDLKCVTWNIHRARGRDGRVDPDRIHHAIATEIATNDLDLLALQEADEECRPHARLLDMKRLADDTSLSYMHDEDRLRWGAESDGFLGTILFLHPRFKVAHRDVLDLPGHCHRGAVSIEATHEGTPFRVMSMHLSLSQPLRILQMRIIGQYLR